MDLYLKIYDKNKNINHEPIHFNTNDYLVIITDYEKEYFNTSNLNNEIKENDKENNQENNKEN